ncbi:hypothetical protein [Vibrio alginolyticus]
MKDLKYKFISRQNYTDNYQSNYPFAPSNLDQSEYLICGEGLLNEQQMNEYKQSNLKWHGEQDIR